MAAERSAMETNEVDLRELTEEEDSDQTPPRKKTKLSAVSSQVFLKKYHEEYPCLISSKKGKHFAYCTVCNCDFSVKHSGLYDCRRHMKSNSHEEFKKTRSTQKKLDCFIKKGNDQVKGELEKLTFERSVARQDDSSVQSVRYFLTRFPSLLPPGCTMNDITEQFSSYQGRDLSSCVADRIDQTWENIGSLAQEEEMSLQELSMVMRGILTIPHSSAHCERVFSCVRKNRTAQRASLADTTLESLLVLKSNPLGPAEAVRGLTDDTLDTLKSAYSKSLKAVKK